MGFIASNLCGPKHGAVLVAPSYKLGLNQHQAWPQSRDDVQQAVEWVSRNAQSFGGDPERIILSGHSAGGHLAACVGFDPQRQQSNIKALFLISCPLGVRCEDWFFPRRRWLFRLTSPLARFIYNKTILKFLRPLVGERQEKGKSTLVTIDSTESTAANKRH